MVPEPRRTEADVIEMGTLLTLSGGVSGHILRTIRGPNPGVYQRYLHLIVPNPVRTTTPYLRRFKHLVSEQTFGKQLF